MLDRLLTGVEVAHRHGLRRTVDGNGLVADPNVDAVRPMLVRGSHDEPIWCLHQSANQVGETAGGVGGA